MDHYIILYIAILCLNIMLFELIWFAYLGEAYFCLICFVRFPTNLFFGTYKFVLWYLLKLFFWHYFY